MIKIDYKSKIREVPDFPKKGILFYDITTLLREGDALKECIEEMHKRISHLKIDAVAGIESRGFIFGVPIALKLGCGFIPIRKPGKLPSEKISASYSLEYGSNSIEMHKDAVKKDQNILLVDDLLATGGTMSAAIALVEKLGGNVAAAIFLIELTFLNGREKLGNHRVESLIKYEK